MRRSLTSSFVLLAAAVITVGLSGTASAAAAPVSSKGGCVAAADVPHLDVGGTNRIITTGRFECATAATGTKITVCIEEQYSTTGPWYSRGCTTASDLYEYRTAISATHSMSVPVYATWLRTSVTASNAAGGAATYTSAPVFWFNCACYIG